MIYIKCTSVHEECAIRRISKHGHTCIVEHLHSNMCFSGALAKHVHELIG